MNHFCKAGLSARPRRCTSWHYRSLQPGEYEGMPAPLATLEDEDVDVTCSKGGSYLRMEDSSDSLYFSTRFTTPLL